MDVWTLQPLKLYLRTDNKVLFLSPGATCDNSGWHGYWEQNRYGCGHTQIIIHLSYRGDDAHLRTIVIEPCDNGSANEMGYLTNGEPKAIITPRGTSWWNTQTNMMEDDVDNIIAMAIRLSGLSEGDQHDANTMSSMS